MCCLLIENTLIICLKRFLITVITFLASTYRLDGDMNYAGFLKGAIMEDTEYYKQ